ncbi:MAG: hypothetical protein GKS06_09120 [Acidobacteria bacterium]|nr:hypothetical protein [Acidobacteriota bacterium]
MTLRTLIVAVALISTSAIAQERGPLAGEDRLICDAGLVVDCTADGECTSGAPESVGLPRFLDIDLANETLASPSPDFEEEDPTPLAEVVRDDGLIVIGGRGRLGRTFAVRINESTGDLRGTVMDDELALLVFGGCVAVPE